MNKKERRINILKDVLKQLKAEKFEATTGTYVGLPKELNSKIWNGRELDAKTELLACTKSCKVCAKGSIFLSQVRKENQVKLGELDWDMEDEDNEATKRVVDLFGGNNLNKIEAAFEKWTYIVPKDELLSYFDFTCYSQSGGFYPYRKKDENLSKFVKKYPNKKNRLEAIVRNAIRNNGIFKP